MWKCAHLEITEAVLVHCNIVSNDYQQDQKVLHTFVPNKSFDHAKRSTTDSLKISSKRVIQKTAEATDDLIGNKIANKITKVSKDL